MNNTINRYNSPMFCAKPKEFVSVAVRTLKQGGMKTVIQSERNLTSGIDRETTTCFKNGVKCYKEDRRVCHPENYGESTYMLFDPETGKLICGKPVRYKLDPNL